VGLLIKVKEKLGLLLEVILNQGFEEERRVYIKYVDPRDRDAKIVLDFSLKGLPGGQSRNE